MAGNTGFMGLRDVCLLFQEHLSNLDFRQQGMGDAVRERLEEWPILVIGYLGAPADPQASEPLIDHLCSPAWSTPLPETDAGVLRSMLMCGAQAPDTANTMDAEWANVAMEESSPIPAMASAEPARVLQLPPAVETTEPLLTEPALTEPALTKIPAGASTSEQPTETVEKTEIEVEAEGEATAEVEPVELPELMESVAVTAPATMADMTARIVVEEESVTFTEAVTEMKEEAETVAESEETESADEDEDKEPAGAMAGSSEAYQELLGILCAEIAQIAETANEILVLATVADSAPAARSEALFSYAEHLERLGDASASIGLTGLQQVCAGLQANLSHRAAQDSPLDAEQQRVVKAWPNPALNYLQALDDHSRLRVPGQSLARCALATTLGCGRCCCAY